ncbi:MAG TPA: DMT family transporter [Pilimelia sp.]|nr:DMT family transporter [Pilimelia sp.]
MLALALLPAVSGVLLSWQAAVNGRVGQAAGGVLPAILLNFVTGTAGLLVAFGIDLAVRGPTGPLPTEPVLYTGGLFGVVFIAMAVTVVRYTGVLLLGLATIGGQVCGAVAIDLVSPPPGGRPGPYTLAGAALTLVAVAVAAAARRPTRA